MNPWCRNILVLRRWDQDIESGLAIPSGQDLLLEDLCRTLRLPSDQATSLQIAVRWSGPSLVELFTDDGPALVFLPELDATGPYWARNVCGTQIVASTIHGHAGMRLRALQLLADDDTASWRSPPILPFTSISAAIIVGAALWARMTPAPPSIASEKNHGLERIVATLRPLSIQPQPVPSPPEPTTVNPTFKNERTAKATNQKPMGREGTEENLLEEGKSPSNQEAENSAKFAEKLRSRLGTANVNGSSTSEHKISNDGQHDDFGLSRDGKSSPDQLEPKANSPARKSPFTLANGAAPSAKALQKWQSAQEDACVVMQEHSDKVTQTVCIRFMANGTNYTFSNSSGTWLINPSNFETESLLMEVLRSIESGSPCTGGQ